jgi:anti-sigma-K factor RskA
MAAGIGAIAVGVWVSSSYENRLEALAQETRALRAELERQQSILALVRDPTAQVVSLAGLEPAPAARARVIWSPPSGGLLVATGLPSPPAGKTYQLWAIAGNRPPVPAGLLEVDSRGAGSLRLPALPGMDAVDVFAVTLEPGGGVPAPTGPMYLAGKSAA